MQGAIIIPHSFTTVFILSDTEKGKHLQFEFAFAPRNKISSTNSLYPLKLLDIVWSQITNRYCYHFSNPISIDFGPHKLIYLSKYINSYFQSTK